MRGWGKKYAKILGIQIQTTISLYSRYPYRFIRCQSMASLREKKRCSSYKYLSDAKP